MKERSTRTRSDEAVIYSKSRVLYGLNWSKTDIAHVGEAIVCEGYTDVIGFALAGLPRAVATCGTALTEDHVRLLQRFAKRFVLAFDADAAGQGATERVYEWETKHNVEFAVADLPPGVDPADLARTDPAQLSAAVAQCDSVARLSCAPCARCRRHALARRAGPQRRGGTGCRAPTPE